MANELNRQAAQNANPLSGVSLDDLMDRMTGADERADSGRMVAKPTSIYAWRPDLRQPRRAVPANVRGDWTGSADELPVLLAKWIEHVEGLAGLTIPIEKAVRGEWERPTLSENADVSTLIELIDLAASIYKDGLINPIRGAAGVIESGERRWLAYHLLHMFSGKDYSKIPTIEKSEVDVWAQAAENGSRTPLNAIGMARQIALLVMAMYEGDAGVKFDRFETLVLPGGSDRAFYAQVANGEVYRVKRGLGERILNVTGLKSMDHVRRYRALLSMPDGLWVKADAQSWTEWQIRDYLDGIKGGNPDITKLHTVTGVTVSGGSAGVVEGNDIPKTERVRGVSGLYVDRPASPQKANLTPSPSPKGGGSQRAVVRADYDDDFDDFDDDGVEWVDEPGYAPVADWPEQEEMRRSLESSTAILATWDAQGHKVRAVLEMLRSVTEDKNAKVKITELMTLAPADIAQNLQGTRGPWWDTYVQECIAVLEPLLVKHVQTALYEYVMYLKQEGDYLRDKYQRG